MTLFLVSISLIYLVLMTVAGEIFQNISEEKNNPSPAEFVGLSIVVPFRNEAANIPALIESLSLISYPPEYFEVLFCDDHSTDDSIFILNSQLRSFPFSHRILSNTDGINGKKASINNSVQQAQFEYIITTDADCTMPSGWLHAVNSFLIINKSAMIIGPVKYNRPQNSGILDTYQIIENSGLVAIGAAAITKGFGFMANGANLCFRKSIFQEVQGYMGNEKIPSGDDEFLLQKFRKHSPGKIHFLKNKEALITTSTQNGTAAFIDQRVRWASKARFHKNPAVLVSQIAIALYFLSLIFNPGFSNLFAAMLPIAIKILGDLFFFNRIKGFFGIQLPLPDQILVSLLQIIFTPVIGILALFGRYKWKDRKYRI